MFNLGKKKSARSVQPLTAHFIDATKRAQPIPFTLNSTDLTGLLMEAIHFGKIIATEQRDLEAIRNEYSLKKRYLEDQHNQIILELQEYYGERKDMIARINAIADTCIAAGQFEMANALLNRLIDMVSNHSPLRTAMDLRDKRMLT